jgi:hypothetical protein
VPIEQHSWNESSDESDTDDASGGRPVARRGVLRTVRHRIDPELSERAVNGEKADRVDGEVLLLDDWS